MNNIILNNRKRVVTPQCTGSNQVQQKKKKIIENKKNIENKKIMLYL